MTKRFTFVMEQTLGHIPFAQNLRLAFEAEPALQVNWLPINYKTEKRVEKLPVIRSNWALRASLKAQQAIKAERQAHGPSDLYLFHTQSVGLMGAKWASRFAPVITSLDATPLNYDRVGAAYGHQAGNSQAERVKFWLYKRAFEASTHLVTWSEWARQSLIDDYGVAGDKVTVIPPGTDLSLWKAQTAPTAHEGKLKLLFVGGDFERKGGKMLFESFHQALSDRFELHIVTRDEVEAGNGVFVYHNVAPNSPELQKLFRQADAFVLPTEGDCLPVAITEAMAAGLPVISTKVGAIEEAVIEGRNGFLIAPGQKDGLIGVLKRLADNSQLRHDMGQQSLRLAAEKFDAAKNSARLLSLCHSLTPGASLHTAPFKNQLAKLSEIQTLDKL